MKSFRNSLRWQNDPEQWWEGALFVFDTSALLNLYRYEPEHSTKLLDYLGRLSGRIWIPHQVDREFHRNREQVIREQLALYSQFPREIRKHWNLISEARGKIEQEITEHIEERHPRIDEDKLRQIVAEKFSFFDEMLDEIVAYLKSCGEGESKLETRLDTDPIYDRLHNLFGNGVGSGYMPERQVELFELGVLRYKHKVPPGYMDNNENQKPGYRKFGDLLIWFQILDKAAEVKRPIILVTDDTKEDWWENAGKADAQPRPELVREMNEIAGVPYHMFSSVQFIEYAERHLGELVDPEVKKEVQTVRESDLRRERQKALAQARAEVLAHPFKRYYSLSDVDVSGVNEALRRMATDDRHIQALMDGVQAATQLAEAEGFSRAGEMAARLASMGGSTRLAEVLGRIAPFEHRLSGTYLAPGSEEGKKPSKEPADSAPGDEDGEDG